jgi:hypothetical protein
MPTQESQNMSFGVELAERKNAVEEKQGRRCRVGRQ